MNYFDCHFNCYLHQLTCKVFVNVKLHWTQRKYQRVNSHFILKLFQVKTKTTSKELDHINKVASDLLMILSRPARLLECLEFNPAEFYTQLEFEEQCLTQHKEQNTDGVTIEMGDYIRNKLGIVPPEHEEKPDEGESGNDEKPANRKVP